MLQVIDDAIKIGLGGIIGGIFAWIVARHNNKSVIKKLEFERRTRILSEVAESYENFFQQFFEFSTCLCVLAETAGKKADNPQAQALFDAFFQTKLNQANRIHVEKAQRLHETIKAQSQLLLLGEQSCMEKAQAMMSAMMGAEASYKFDGKSFDMSQYEQTGKIVRAAREAFYKEMQKAFKNY
ncbi:MAG TPA: hypothetical protein VJT54_08280 [Verrucomicrobiae bacterium]|nr:hypothetical protein [Verrucomicrobiae bacterium]